MSNLAIRRYWDNSEHPGAEGERYAVELDGRTVADCGCLEDCMLVTNALADYLQKRQADFVGEEIRKLMAGIKPPGGPSAARGEGLKAGEP